MDIQYFDRLDHLVTYYSQPGQGLPCELRVPVVGDQEFPDDDSGESYPLSRGGLTLTLPTLHKKLYELSWEN